MPSRVAEPPMPIDADLAARCGAVEVLVLDVDGVLTDGVIAVDDRGVETKHFHVRDGSALSLWRRAGKRVAILSGRRAAAVDHRARELGITPVIQGAAEKGAPLRALLAEWRVEPRAVCYVGDDLADLPALATAGLAACPADAAPEVCEASHYVARAGGGRGAVREIVELVLRQQSRWEGLVASFLEPGEGGPS